MKQLYVFIIIIQFGFLPAQKYIEYDEILKIDNITFHDHEIRIYKNHSVSTGLELFRFYQDKKNNWKAEFYTTVASGNNKDKVVIRKSKLNSLKNPELIWTQILDTDVIYLPEMNQFEYKLERKNKDYQIEDGEIISSVSISSVLDGVSYFVKIRNHEIQNDFEYNNPESYLKLYPSIDELLSFQNLLNFLRNEFKIFVK